MDTERKANQPVNADSSDDDIRDRAREIHETDGEIELDIDAEISRCETDPEGAYVQAWVWVPFEEEEGEEFYFTMTSAEYGTEEYGPYDTEDDALAGIERVKAGAAKLNDNVVRCFSDPHPREDDEDEG